MDLRLTRFRGRLLTAVVVATALVGAGVWAVVPDDGPAVRRVERTFTVPESPGDDRGTVRVDASYFTAGESAGRRPAVLLAHGFGGDKTDLRGRAEELARAGYAVLTWSARGFGASTGRIGLNDPEREVADVSRLIDWLAKRPEVRLDGEGDPRVGVAGASYGGAVSLLAAGYDERVDAIAPSITYWDLSEALFPGGVFKELWSGVFFTTGSAGAAPSATVGTPPGSDSGAGTDAGGGAAPDAPTGSGTGTGTGAEPPAGAGPDAGPGPAREAAGCGRFSAELCAMYERVAVAGEPDEAARELLRERSPVAVADRIDVPALIVQGRSDSLFPLDHADAMAEAIRANGAPVAVDWIAGGHDSGSQAEAARVADRTRVWFDRHLKGDADADTGPAFRVTRTGGMDTTDGEVRLRAAEADAYPGLSAGDRAVALRGPEQSFANPAGGSPPAVSAVPGLGGLGGLSGLGVSLSLDHPGRHARFESAPLGEAVRVTGSPTVRVRVATDADDGEAVLFAKLYDVGPDGRQVLPAQLVTPLRVTDAGEGRTVEVRLPAIDHRFESGHRMRLVLSTTDLAYASPVEPAVHTVSLAGDGVRVPVVPGLETEADPLPWWVWGLPLLGLVTAAALLLTGRRRRGAPTVSSPDAEAAPEPAAADTDPEREDVPLEISGLSKRYAGATDRYAVRDLSFRVERGQVLGLLGPNGAGKTTTLRMLMGLISPDDGEVRVFGRRVRPGAPVLSRVGAFVEGAGFLPHLSGRANLELYWKATGRPERDAHLAEALEIAGLGDALERAVRTYSQGMRQRLAIAQAMLGLPDLLILDEPTNGLDPPQIREMREVMIRYASDGRTVIVSSHLLAEVEQTCTHLVVMDRGRLVRTGPVEEITGSGDTVLVGVRGPVPETLPEKVAALPGVGSAAPTEEGLLVRLDGAGVPELLAELLRMEVPVVAVGPHRRLEDAFLTLIGGER
ncbi:alpha/beta fold hydrolase [Streptomyces sp. TRM43335]|uniref:Alpha/beta fold hydrolase n=1 Tax=Streptomyces taklimakanensis TaxID=2569853 RepID=A0A6G2BF54_9ACTN|nr:alpha/beta fold hydrolase [Streptomyces taklimakanensis]MTE20693.1 alpha/beta fold hydrolase [Streptomyces taklimakanensis]